MTLQLQLPDSANRVIREKMASGDFGRPEDVVLAALAAIDQRPAGDFSRGELDALLAQGERSITGDVIGLNLGVRFESALFEIEGPEGCIVSITNGPDATLTGSNGGSMRLHIGTPWPVTPAPASRAAFASPVRCLFCNCG